MLTENFAHYVFYYSVLTYLSVSLYNPLGLYINRKEAANQQTYESRRSRNSHTINDRCRIKTMLNTTLYQ